jgi:hypothetical protein
LKEAPAGIASAFWKLDPVLSCIFFVVCGESSQCEDICQTSANHYNPLRKFEVHPICSKDHLKVRHKKVSTWKAGQKLNHIKPIG